MDIAEYEYDKYKCRILVLSKKIFDYIVLSSSINYKGKNEMNKIIKWNQKMKKVVKKKNSLI